MRLTGTQEWIVIGVLIAYIAFTPGFPMVRQFLSTSLGKAIGLGVVVWTWKNVSQPVALLLLVNFVRCSGMREYLDNPPPSTPPKPSPCPENHELVDGQCKNKTTGQMAPMVSSMAPPPPSPPIPSPPSTSSTTTKQPFTNMTPAMYGGVQPSVKDDKYAPA